MIEVVPVPFISIDDIKSNFAKYKEIFLRDKIVVFRDANLTKEEQTDLMIFLGDNLNWYPNSSNRNPSDYIEDHHKHMVNGVYANKDQLMLAWHIEHVQNQEDPFLGSTWRMEKFECPEDSGHTYFVDMCALFNSLSEQDQEFMKKSVGSIKLRQSYYNGDEVKIVEDVPKFNQTGTHPLTGETSLRTFLGSRPEHGTHDIFLFDGRPPSNEERVEYLRIIKHICDQVWDNPDVRMVHKWKQGDIAIPDLYKLAHAVSGGFVENQRTLSGQFAKFLPWSPR